MPLLALHVVAWTAISALDVAAVFCTARDVAHIWKTILGDWAETVENLRFCPENAKHRRLSDRRQVRQKCVTPSSNI